mmetsp:Transcript_41138/g.113401  ORF Transcript_41138/g.113401 Transcript_41138/m.113401 type:complete len:264 (-) Transcript_41138:557-1348(-)
MLAIVSHPAQLLALQRIRGGRHSMARPVERLQLVAVQRAERSRKSVHRLLARRLGARAQVLDILAGNVAACELRVAGRRAEGQRVLDGGEVHVLHPTAMPYAVGPEIARDVRVASQPAVLCGLLVGVEVAVGPHVEDPVETLDLPTLQIHEHPNLAMLEALGSDGLEPGPHVAALAHALPALPATLGAHGDLEALAGWYVQTVPVAGLADVFLLIQLQASAWPTVRAVLNHGDLLALHGRLRDRILRPALELLRLTPGRPARV